MANTENYNLKLADESDLVSEFVSDYNANLQKMDGLPLPVKSGSNSQLEYVEYSDGRVEMYGRIDYGTRMPCNIPGGDGTYYTSEMVTVTFPVPLVSTAPAVIAHVASDPWGDIWWLTREITNNYMKGLFYARGDDSASGTKKVLNVEVKGRWK